MGDEKGTSGRHQRPAGQPAVTPDMLWPDPVKDRKQRAEQSARVVRLDHHSVRARMSQPNVRARTEHPSVRGRQPSRQVVLLPVPEPRVVLSDRHSLVDLSDCGNRCGNGAWCEACRADIRAEALRWLRELNVPRTSAEGNVLSWSRAWNREILLADH